ncbi:MAG: 2-oxo acid dehydrogenase subunit E2 [Bacteroidales bacterium]|nr:2-oxo acid dehydrogenase subunit E2 [Bacteroidales bacterium]
MPQFEIVMPKLGESITEATITKWFKKENDIIDEDEVLLEIATDKVDSEIPSPADGILVEILAGEQETVAVDAVLGRLETEKAGMGIPMTSTPVSAKKTAAESAKVPSKSDKPSVAVMTGKEKEVDSQAGKKLLAEKWEKTERFFSPLVKNIARQEGISQVELERIAGSGTGRRVTKKDILSYLQQRPDETHPPSTISSGGSGKTEIFAMDTVRKKIAEHMRQSLDTSAHVYSVSECDMSRVMTILQNQREEFFRQEGFKLTVTPFFLYAAVRALLDFPRVNSSLEGDKIIEKKYINLGIAVAAPKGLIVPVVKNAEEKSFRGIARAVNDLVNRARHNKLTYDDIQGSTFSVTNYGIFGNIIGLPIINQPKVAIMGIGAIKKRPVVIEKPDGDFIAIRSMAFISMSYDHRLVDGELGGRFMQKLVEYLEGMEGELL